MKPRHFTNVKKCLPKGSQCSSAHRKKQKMLCIKKRTRIARKFFKKKANDELENNDENTNEIVNLKVNNFPPKGAGRGNGGVG